jgi:hypothetical protein
MAEPKSLDAFLADSPLPSTGGRQCATCTHLRAGEINRDLLSFVARRRLSSDDPQATTYPWIDFVRRYLRERYADLPRADASIKRHAERCLELEVPS